MNKKAVQKETQEYLIIKRNDLIQTTAFGLTNAEYDMLNYIIMKIRPTDDDLYEQEIVIRDYCRVMGLSEDDNYATVRKTAKGLADKSVWAFMENEDGEKEIRLVRWIEDPSIHRGRISVQLKSYWKPYLLNVDKNYTSLVIQETVSMKSIYGKRIYEILKSHIMNRKGPVIIRFEIDELKRLLLGNEDYKEKYKRFDNFKARVLDEAMNDMREYGDLKVSYKPIKEGYSYGYIEFVIEEKTLDEKLDAWKREKRSLGKKQTEKKQA